MMRIPNNWALVRSNIIANQITHYKFKRYFSDAPKSRRYCVVGSGPAGFYSLESILKSDPNAKVDIIERFMFLFRVFSKGLY